MSKTIDIAPAELTIVRQILRQFLPPETRVWVFGSRANGTARRYSDLDLGLEAAGTLSLDVMGEITEALSESDLPYKVDVIDLRAVDAGFRALIEPGMVALAA